MVVTVLTVLTANPELTENPELTVLTANPELTATRVTPARRATPARRVIRVTPARKATRGTLVTKVARVTLAPLVRAPRITWRCSGLISLHQPSVSGRNPPKKP